VISAGEKNKQTYFVTEAFGEVVGVVEVVVSLSVVGADDDDDDEEVPGSEVPVFLALVKKVVSSGNPKNRGLEERTSKSTCKGQRSPREWLLGQQSLQHSWRCSRPNP
jgi:hypothetical protein